MILTLSVVLLATFDYIHATQCSTQLADYMNTKCRTSINFKLTYAGISECSFKCQGKNPEGQSQITTHNLMNGLPCGQCKECCNGRCTPVKFRFGNPSTFDSCAKQGDSS
uniref:Putative ixostatin n=1 Tax=Ixodes ricinus TaxID=34613 RepID=A0A0K8R4M1_IXORI